MEQLQQEIWQGFNLSGSLVYKFNSQEEAAKYGIKINCKSKKFCTTEDLKGKEIRFYKEEETKGSNTNLVNQVISDQQFPMMETERLYLYSLSLPNTITILHMLKSMKTNKKESTVTSSTSGGSTVTYVVKKAEQALINAKDGGNYDTAGNSEHYQKQFMELVREQERKYGTIVAYLFCIGNVDKYAGRAGEKAGVPAEKDLIKKSWYQKAARHFKIKIEAERNKTVAPDRNVYVNMPEEVKDLICCEQPFSELFNVGYIPLSVAIEK